MHDGSGLFGARWQWQPSLTDHADTGLITLESLASNLTADHDTTNRTATAYSTINIGFVEGRLYLLAIRGRTATIAPSIGSVAGGGNTWNLLQTVNVGTSVTLWLYYAVAVSTTYDTIDITPDGVTTWTQGGWIVDEIVTSVASPVVQSAQNSETASHTELTVTLAAFADAVENIAYGVFAHNEDTLLTPGAGFTDLGSSSEDTENTNRIRSIWKIGEDTGVDITSASTTSDVFGIAAEIALVVTAGGGALPWIYRSHTHTIGAGFGRAM